MTARSKRPDPSTPRPLSKWIIRVGTLVVLAVTVVVAAVIWFVLRRLYGGQGAQVQLDVIRTAGTLVIGIGGAVALLLTARRQRYTELSLVHTDRDATERRITELYTRAADLLGSEQAPVRLAGLYALDRLAHSAVEHRQTIVNVICAYLCMPYTSPPPYRSPGPARRRRARTLTDQPPHATPTSSGSRQKQAQERQVRLTAQNILPRNLHSVRRRRRWWPPAHRLPAWPWIGLDLAGALLLEFSSLSERELDYADFTRAQFIGKADFKQVKFTQRSGRTSFKDAQFTGEANFWGAEFADWANFQSCVTDFEAAQFTGMVNFKGVRFAGKTNFKFAQFGDGASFRDLRPPLVSDAQLPRWALCLGLPADFYFEYVAPRWAAQFPVEIDFTGARVALDAELSSVWPPGWTTRPPKPGHGEDPAFRHLIRDEEGHPPDA